MIRSTMSSSPEPASTMPGNIICVCPLFTCACVNVCMYAFLCVHVCSCVYVCVCVHACVCACVRVCVSTGMIVDSVHDTRIGDIVFLCIDH